MRERPLRVLHVAPTYYPNRADGGPPRSMFFLGRAIARTGRATIRVLTTNADGKDHLDARTDAWTELEPGLSVQYHARRVLSATAPTLPAAIHRELGDCDLVHLTSAYNFPTLPTLLSARLLAKPIVWTARGALQRWPGARKPIAKDAWMAAGRAIAPHAVLHFTSREEEAESRSRVGALRTCVIGNGVDVPDAAPARVASDALRIGFLGRIHPMKRLPLLLDAVAIAQPRITRRVRVVVAGEGDADYRRSVETHARERGVEMTLLGHVPDERKASFFAEVDLLACVSTRENFGLSIAEALAFGVPVLATRGTPWPWLDDEGAGYWVDDDAIASAIARAAHDDLPSMGMNGRRKVAAELGWDRAATQMCELYASLARETPRARSWFARNHA